MPDPFDPRSAPPTPPRAQRTLGTWLILAGVWTLGLVVWAVYLGLGFVLLLRLL